MSSDGNQGNMMILPPNGRNQDEDIALDYVVRYDDGFRSSIHVYGIDYASRTRFGGIARIAVSIGVDTQLVDLSKIDPLLALFSELAGIDAAIGTCGISIGTQINGRGYEKPLDSNPDWEFELQMDARGENMNCVKICEKSDIDAALKQHAKNYSLQFKELGTQMMDLFERYLEEHPGYKMGESFSPGNMGKRD
jgi:hypothetical protein